MSVNELIEEFKRHFSINTDLKNVTFSKFHTEPYDTVWQSHSFGEKICLLYRIELTAFNINFMLKLLAFKYEDHAEALKLEIRTSHEGIEKEITPCKNFLQRKRNINLTFQTLVKFAQLYETRRLIDLIVFQKQRSVLTKLEDGSLIAKCCDDDFKNKFLEFTWTIAWEVDSCEVTDFIEFYLNYSSIEEASAQRIKQNLECLVESDIGFQSKLKLWKALMEDLYGATLKSQSSKKVNQSSDVMEISDSESDESVVEVDLSCDNTYTDDVLCID